MNVPANKHPLYTTWIMMRQRCNNPKSANYEYYGGRGIAICPEWDSFQQFVDDMGDRPDGHTLDRKDVNGPYSAANCRWACGKTQANNKRKRTSYESRYITYNGVTKCIGEWAKDTGIKPDTLYWRFRRDWPVEKMLGKEDNRRKD